MPVYAMPVILLIEADNLQDAQQSLEDWNDELDMETLPVGTDSIDHIPACEIIEGQRVLYLSLEEEDVGEDNDTKGDDFNDFDPDTDL